MRRKSEKFDKNGYPTYIKPGGYKKKKFFVGEFRLGEVKTQGSVTELFSRYAINGFDDRAQEKPVHIWLMGGPGLPFSRIHFSYADPEYWVHCVFNQRGSRAPYDPEARIDNSNFEMNLHDNNTGQMVEDVETFRRFLVDEMHLNADKVVISGGSWGTVLAVEYAKKYPRHVLGMTLTGLVLGREEDWRRIMSDDILNMNIPEIKNIHEKRVSFAMKHSALSEEIKDFTTEKIDAKNLIAAYREMLDSNNIRTKLSALMHCRLIDEAIEGYPTTPPEEFHYNPKDHRLLRRQGEAYLHERIKIEYFHNNAWLHPKLGILNDIEILRNFSFPIFINLSRNDPFVGSDVTPDFLMKYFPKADILWKAKGIHHGTEDIVGAVYAIGKIIAGSEEKRARYSPPMAEEIPMAAVENSPLLSPTVR